MDRVARVPTLFVLNGTAVKVRPGFWVLVLGLWGVLGGLGRWRWPGQGWAAYGLVGGAGVLLALLADVGHACAHTVSARLAGAPMDVILLGADMPRTLYFDNQVTPRQHIGRSLGGPVYSGLGLLLGIGWLLLAPGGTAVRYLGEVWALAHGGIFLGAFAPLQIVDGGVILKWALVLRGHGEAQAERIVRRLAVGVGVILVVVMGAWLVWR